MNKNRIPLTRSILQGLNQEVKRRERKAIIDTTVSTVYQNCIDVAAQGITRYVFNAYRLPFYQTDLLPAHFTENDRSLYITELVKMLRLLFPDSEVSLRNTSIITICWD
jgi:hypothetical protein